MKGIVEQPKRCNAQRATEHTWSLRTEKDRSQNFLIANSRHGGSSEYEEAEGNALADSRKRIEVKISDAQETFFHRKNEAGDSEKVGDNWKIGVQMMVRC